MQVLLDYSVYVAYMRSLTYLQHYFAKELKWVKSSALHCATESKNNFHSKEKGKTGQSWARQGAGFPSHFHNFDKVTYRVERLLIKLHADAHTQTQKQSERDCERERKGENEALKLCVTRVLL